VFPFGATDFPAETTADTFWQPPLIDLVAIWVLFLCLLATKKKKDKEKNH